MQDAPLRAFPPQAVLGSGRSMRIFQLGATSGSETGLSLLHRGPFPAPSFFLLVGVTHAHGYIGG